MPRGQRHARKRCVQSDRILEPRETIFTFHEVSHGPTSGNIDFVVHKTDHVLFVIGEACDSIDYLGCFQFIVVIGIVELVSIKQVASEDDWFGI